VIVKSFLFASLCFVGEQAAIAQIVPPTSTNVTLTESQADPNSGATVTKPGFNSDPRILRDIVRAEAAKRGCEAVEFGIWVGNNQIVTMALRDSMTGVPARTDMHYRYSGAFGYNMPNGVTITLETTKGEGSTDDAAAFDILREVVKYVTPNSPIAF
jgi:hypothetical protein